MFVLRDVQCETEVGGYGVCDLGSSARIGGSACILGSTGFERFDQISGRESVEQLRQKLGENERVILVNTDLCMNLTLMTQLKRVVEAKNILSAMLPPSASEAFVKVGSCISRNQFQMVTHVYIDHPRSILRSVSD